MKDIDYWKECIICAADEIDLELTDSQVEHLAESVSGGHEHYGMAFYSPPPSDRISSIEEEWRRRLADLQAEFDAYRNGSERAARRALGFHPDTQVSITKDGEVFRHGGRTEQVL